jgi:hypothetical protein
MIKDRIGSGQKSSDTITRRSLFAAVSLAATAVGAKIARANAPSHIFHVTAPGGHCYLSGTRILTPQGPRDIASLRIGDLVNSLSGATRPIKWIGRNTFTRRSSEPWPLSVMPVKVTRLALDGRAPTADLFMSAGHALYLDGMLIEVSALINGRTIVRDAAADKEVLEYFHLELPTHDVIFAEGAASETFLLGAGGPHFDNWSERTQLFGGGEPRVAPFAPEIRMGARAQIRSRLRSAISPWFDRRQPFDIVRDRLDEHALWTKAT